MRCACAPRDGYSRKQPESAPCPSGVDSVDVNQFPTSGLPTRNGDIGDRHPEAVGEEPAECLVRGPINRRGREPYPNGAVVQPINERS